MRRYPAAVVISAVATATALAACSSTSASHDPSTGKAASTASAKKSGKSGKSKPAGELLASGFGQSDEYVWVTSLVKNNASTVGQTVTVQFNLYDKTGSLIGSDSQVESFASIGQLLAVGTQIDLKAHQKAARVKATLLVEDEGVFSDEPFPAIKTSAVKVGKDEFGGVSASFDVLNPTNKPLKDPRIGIICYNAKKQIIGGGDEFPDLVPPSGKYHVDSSVNVSGTPATCTAYAGPDLDF
jgi:hypothetical protein